MLIDWLLVATTVPLLVSAQVCHNPGAAHFQLNLPAQGITIDVPPIPTNVSLYSYATNNALVAIPKKCAEDFSMSPNFKDKTGGPSGMHYFRISAPAKEYAMLQQMSRCACGLVILLHGSGGPRWSSVAYAKMFAGFGYVVLMLDSTAMPDYMGLKGVGHLKTTDAINTSDYWGPDSSSWTSCSDFQQPFCYETKTANILHDKGKYQVYLERNYFVRQLEMDYFFEHQATLLNGFSKIFLLGRSEGAGIAARYHHPTLDAKLSGRILSGYACDFNYFVSCARHAMVCGNLCNKTVPQLNLVGKRDRYFSAMRTSVSMRVASNYSHGYGGPISGSCRRAYDMQGFETATVVTFEAGHALIPKFDNAVRSILADFAYMPSTPGSWPSLNRTGCRISKGIWSCSEVGDAPTIYRSTWGTNVSDSFSFIGSMAKCSDSIPQQPNRARMTSGVASSFAFFIIQAFLV